MAEKNKCPDVFWVQCEYPQCMKWRKIPSSQRENVKEIHWYCHMNPEKCYSFCEAPQERMHVMRGETVVFSELELGSLVMARMSGYPSWPAVITKDPVEQDGAYIIRYADGTNDPKYYHVEFLGDPHSHAWVSARFIQVYNTSTVNLIFGERSMKKKKVKEQFQKSNQEALQFMNISSEERLKRCIFQWKENFNQLNTEENVCLPLKKKQTKSNILFGKSEEVQKISEAAPYQTMMVNFNGTLYPVLVPPIPEKNENNNNITKDLCGVNSQPSYFHQPDSKNSFFPSSQFPVFDFDYSFNAAHHQSKQPKNKINEQSAVGHSGKIVSPFPLKFKQSDKRSTITKHVNMKFPKQKKEGMKPIKKHPLGKAGVIFDSEEDFWLEFNNFWSSCKENGKLHDKSPNEIFWRRKCVDLYKFYQTVQYAGGYRQAISHWKIWRNVCWEVFGDHSVDSEFLTLRKAYRKTLLPFENNSKDNGLSRSTIQPMVNEASTSNKEIISNFTRNQVVPTCSQTKAIVPPSPVFLPQAIGLMRKKTSPLLKHPSSFLPLNHNTGEILKGLAPKPLQKTSAAGTNAIPSSNPESPMCFVSPGCLSTATDISDVGLDVAMEELKDLEETIGNINQADTYTLSEDIFSQEDPDDPKEANVLNSYLPTFESSQQSVEFNDVIGELSSLEDTLLELAGDILSGTAMKN